MRNKERKVIFLHKGKIRNLKGPLNILYMKVTFWISIQNSRTVPTEKNIVIKCSSAKKDFLNHMEKLELVKNRVSLA